MLCYIQHNQLNNLTSDNYSVTKALRPLALPYSGKPQTSLSIRKPRALSHMP